MIGYANYPDIHAAKTKLLRMTQETRQMREYEEQDVMQQMNFLCVAVLVILHEEVTEAMLSQMDEGF